MSAHSKHQSPDRVQMRTLLPPQFNLHYNYDCTQLYGNTPWSPCAEEDMRHIRIGFHRIDLNVIETVILSTPFWEGDRWNTEDRHAMLKVCQLCRQNAWFDAHYELPAPAKDIWIPIATWFMQIWENIDAEDRYPDLARELNLLVDHDLGNVWGEVPFFAGRDDPNEEFPILDDLSALTYDNYGYEI